MLRTIGPLTVPSLFGGARLWAVFAIGVFIPLSQDSHHASAQQLMPAEDFAPGWRKAEAGRSFTGQDLFNHINGGADLFLEFGFNRLLVQRYTDGSAELVLSAYEMENATAALGVYLMKMGRESPFPEIDSRNSSDDAQATILEGRWFLQVDNFGQPAAPRSVVAALANDLIGRIPDESPQPLLDLLPPADRKAGSERLIRGPVALQPFFTFGEGDVLMLEGETFGVLADYEKPDGTRWTHLIIVYPSPEAATGALDNLRARLDPYLSVTETREYGFDFLDYQSRGGSVDRSGARLEIRFKVAELN